VLSVSICLCVLGVAGLLGGGIGFLKSSFMYKIVVGLVINFWFFKRELPFHLT
jgi:hypothetical protein